jgi:putative peptidoglycan lipid II flippase
MNLIKAMMTVGGLTLVSRIAGFIRDVITAATLGAGPIADAFFVALKLPNFFRSITAEGAFSISFVPLYSEKMVKESEEAAGKFASHALSIMIAVLLPFSILVMWAMPLVVMFLAPGFVGDDTKMMMTVEMARLSFPYLLLVSVAALLGAILNAHNKFGPYAFAPVLFNLCLIGSIYLVTPFTSTQGHAMAIGMSLSGVLQALWVWAYVRRMGLKIQIGWPRLDADTRKLFRLMGPGILVASVFQVNLFINLMIASLLSHGSISYLYYADRLYQLPFGVIGIAVGTALLPLFAQALARKDVHETNALYSRSIEYMLILCLPCAFGLLLAADPIVRMMYQHGTFSGEDARMTIWVLMASSLGLPAYVISRVYNAVFYAHQDTWSPVKVAIVTTTLNMLLSLAFAYFFGVVGIAFASALVGWLSIYLLNRMVAAKKLELTFDTRLKQHFSKICFCTGLMVMTLFMLRYGLHDALYGSFISRLLALLTLIFVAVVIYTSAIFMTKLVTLSDVKKFFTRVPKSQGPKINVPDYTA